VREQLKIVHDENDDYEPGHVPLIKLLSDPPSDIAVLKAHRQLGVMPYRIGRSASLRAGNLVQVRGFPLGAFAALNTGKVLNPSTIDSERGWSHSDIMVDALLNAGNSGSPVFAISCRTAEPELVGVYHAAYTDAAALNAVIAIDQLRDELDTLKVPKRDPAGLHADITAQDRDRLVKLLFAEPTHSITFPFAARSVVATLVDPDTLSETERSHRGIRRLPKTLGEALDELERDEVLKEALSETLAKEYLIVKRSEVRAFADQDAAFEIDQHFYKF